MKILSIIGGGAGGIFAALGARNAALEAGRELEIHLFERNPRLGIKILISGGGKCNITHAGPVEEILKEGFPYTNEQRFLKHALYRFTNDDALAILGRHGVACHTRENGRIFPNSGRAEDVLAAFERELDDRAIRVHTRTRIRSIGREEQKWKLSTDGTDGADGAEFESDALILATGGTSYSKTGTTGDGIRYAELLGHMIVPVCAALAPIYLEHPPVQDLIGIALRAVEVYAITDSRIVATVAGDVLITHRGLSGPAVLGISRLANERAGNGISMKVNLVALPESEVRALLTEQQRVRSQQQVNTWLEEILPNRFVPFVLDQANIIHNKTWHQLTRDERARLLGALAFYDFGAVAEIPLERGEVTAGGVDLREVDSKTMMSRRIPGLFFAGEMLDVAGEIGGYNLQAAYSTGWVAGESAAHFISRPAQK